MSFDLAFYAADGATLTREQIGAVVEGVLGDQVKLGQSPGGVAEWAYTGAQTGVTFRLRHSDPAAAEHPRGVTAEGAAARFSGLAVEVNYVRPRFVGMEALAASGAIASGLGLLMPDPTRPAKAGAPVAVVPTEKAAINLTIEQWMEGNRYAIRSVQKLTGKRPPYLEAERSMYYWRFQRMRESIQKAVGTGAIVPQTRIVRIAGLDELGIMGDWANGFPAVLPHAEVYLLIEARSMDDPQAKVAWTPAYEVFDRLGPILRRMDDRGLTLIMCAGVPESGPMRDAFNQIPRHPLAGQIAEVGLNFIDEPEGEQSATTA